MNPPRLLRITTVPVSLKLLLEGQMNYFMEHGFELRAVSADGPEVRDLAQSGIRHTIVPMTRKITPVRDLVALVRLIRIIREFQPDIVHTHTPKAGLLGMIAAWICRVPIRFHTVAGLPLMESTGWKKRLLLMTERITYACATHVFPNSEGLKRYIEKAVVISTPMRVIGKGSSNGIDTAFFSRTPEVMTHARSIRAQNNIGDHEIVFSFVGRIVRDKGISEIIQAFRRLSETHEHIRLFLIGPFEQDLDPLTDDELMYLHSNPRVVLAGFQKDVRPWLAASDVFVFPSYREGFPNVVMQACCLEVPCIVSDINGCNEIITHKKTGLIVPVKDVEVLLESMQLLLRDGVLRSNFAKAGRAFVTDNFERQHVWELIRAEYEERLSEIQR